MQESIKQKILNCNISFLRLFGPRSLQNSPLRPMMMVAVETWVWDTQINNLRSEFLTAAKMSIVVFWVVTPRGRESGYQRFGVTYLPHLQGEVL
jgi:hypothetical protein